MTSYIKNMIGNLSFEDQKKHNLKAVFFLKLKMTT
jgi:hypothetical protein